ncbi:unnamed protein product [Porites evermanni]|uniref:Death domain-containing protein n=1 Tax=Porites evermanni TaxID=104178 RepID=A0ABN8MRV1_9CNID|nr:unnamed protein product [Porites evermanni]
MKEIPLYLQLEMRSCASLWNSDSKSNNKSDYNTRYENRQLGVTVSSIIDRLQIGSEWDTVESLVTSRQNLTRKEFKHILESEAHPCKRFLDKPVDHGL